MTTRMRTWMFVALITFGWMFVEWLLFELRRVPYRPPHDMKTFLGTEREAIFIIMPALALGWLLIVVPMCLNAGFRAKEYFYLGLYFALLGSILAYAIRFPSWPVTPWHLFRS